MIRNPCEACTNYCEDGCDGCFGFDRFRTTFDDDIVKLKEDIVKLNGVLDIMKFINYKRIKLIRDLFSAMRDNNIEPETMYRDLWERYGEFTHDIE